MLSIHNAEEFMFFIPYALREALELDVIPASMINEKQDIVLYPGEYEKFINYCMYSNIPDELNFDTVSYYIRKFRNPPCILRKKKYTAAIINRYDVPKN